jgi:prevent-host-death family protein
MDDQVTVHEAKTNLSKLLARVENGEEIVIARGSKPVAKLTRIETAKKPRKLGGYEGLVWMADDFDEYWDDEIELIAEGGDGFGKTWDSLLMQVPEESK